MTLKEKKQQFIETWAEMGPKWGVNKGMAQIHALLLVSNQPLCACTIKERLGVSVGCVNMNIRSLQEWELIRGMSIEGQRKEFFEAEKDMWKVMTCIVKKRREEELLPLQTLLQTMCDESDTIQESKETQDFLSTMKEMKHITDKVDKMMNTLVQDENSWMIKGYKLMIR